MGFADELRNMPSRWQYQLGEEVRHLKGRCEAAARDGKRHLTGVEVRFRPLAYYDEYETIWMDGTAVQGYIGTPQQREAERARWSGSKSADTTATHSYTPYRPFTYSESRSEMEWNRDAVAHMLEKEGFTHCRVSCEAWHEKIYEVQRISHLFRDDTCHGKYQETGKVYYCLYYDLSW